jgi:hypothetical protein
MLHSGDQLLVKANDVELLNSVEKITETFIAQYSNLWNRMFETKNKRIVGILVRSRPETGELSALCGSKN